MSKLDIQGLRKIREEAGIAGAIGKDETREVKIIVHMGTCGIASGASGVMAALERIVEEKHPDIGVDEAGCLGICEREPIVTVAVKGKPVVRYARVTPEVLEEIVQSHIENKTVLETHLLSIPREGADAGELTLDWRGPLADLKQTDFFAKQRRVTRKNCGAINPFRIDDYIALNGWSALAGVLTEITPEETLSEIKHSGLRGRGGAGFPTGQKWEFCKNAPGTPKYIVCNADEGDPGAFMDRSQMEGDPQSILEGMTIAAYAIGAEQGVIYVRAEYPLAVTLITHAIEQARSYGLLGRNILGKGLDFDIDVMIGAGAFVCGEETALLHSIEGRRGVPRPKPPFPATSGLYGKPTVINNVETLATVPVIIQHGADWYSKIGTETSRGTKIFSLAGKVANNGLVEVEMGTPVGELIYDIGGGIVSGGKFKAVQCGGPSGGCIPARHLDTPIDYESLTRLGAIMGSGGLVVMDENTCMVDTARYFLEFVQEESCGQCTPCREGTGVMLGILNRITEGAGSEEDIALLEEIGEMIKKTSLCGLGQTAPNPVLSTIRHFRDEYEAHIREKRCPAAVCQMLFRAPCEHACPVGTDASGYNALIAAGKFADAFDLIMERNPLPGVCGRVCTHPCEAKCRRRQIDQPIAVRGLKRFVADYATAGNQAPPPAVQPEKGAVAIIGSGPAGLTAAYHLVRKGRSVTVFEKLPVAGGMPAAGIPDYRLPSEVLEADVERIEQCGVVIKTGVEIGKDLTIDDLFTQGFNAVFIGAGAWKGMALHIEGEDLNGVVPALDLLRDCKLGKPPDVGKTAAVIGGGNAAIDAARTLLRLGCGTVYLIYRRTRAEMPALDEEIEEAFREGVEPYFLTAPLSIIGENGNVAKLKCQTMAQGGFDSSGRKRPKPSGEFFERRVDTVIPAVGQTPDLAAILEDSGVEASERSTICVNPYTYATNRPGVFAGGDAIDGPGTVIFAMETGMKAALAIDRYLGGNGAIVEEVRRRTGIDEMPPPHGDIIAVTERAQERCLSLEARRGNFRETELGFDEAAAVREAARCLRCDFGKPYQPFKKRGKP
ncbi:MAG: NADH-quinone oxidoreductase subunit NuoF [Desulfobacterales bacterium]